MKCLVFFFLSTSIALAQWPGFTARVSPTQPDSTVGAASPGQLYDFYYSAKQAEAFKQLGAASYTRDDQVTKKRFRDRTFTELVQKGHTPNEHYDDYTLIGSGKLEEVSGAESW